LQILLPLILVLYIQKVSSQKFGAKKTDHLGESRPEAPSFPSDQCSQTTLPRIIEKILQKAPSQNDAKDQATLASNRGKGYTPITYPYRAIKLYRKDFYGSNEKTSKIGNWRQN